MTAAQFAEQLGARRTGLGRWQARCPAHQDRSPSLSIREGADGRVLVHCFAGCALDSILAALKLSRRDLQPGPPPTPAELEAYRLLQQERESKAREECQQRRAACERAHRWQAIVNALGAKLARDPDNDTLARAFHAACEKQAMAEQEAEARVRRVCPKG